MRLADFAINDLRLEPDAAKTDIVGVTADSRSVKPGYLFAALKGIRADGAAFAGQAIEQGAAAILADPTAVLPETAQVPVIRTIDPRRALALIAAGLAGHQPETLVAVTGTSGKTSVATFVRQIFTAAGHRAASIGTIGVTRPSGETYGSLTTPDPAALHAILDELWRDKVTHASLEASSHGLDQRRLDGIAIVAAGFTNLGRDHMDYHPTVESYLAAKLRLFEVILPVTGTAVVNADSDVAEAVMAAVRQRGQDLLRVGESGVEIRLVNAVPDAGGQMLTLEVTGRPMTVRLPLLGDFQASNALVAAGLAIGAGIDAEVAISALAGLEGARGRLEKVGETRSGGTVFIDYAHKPEALANALQTLRRLTKARLIVVFGAGGDRDQGKRPLMGEVAAELADVVIVTDDNPRSEPPETIRAAILAASPGAIEIGDRGAAIKAAIAMSEAGDIICIAGKGHETGQIIRDDVLPFSDHEAVAAAIAEADRP